MKKNSTKKTDTIDFSALPRSAGILLHITSLPSPFGIGDVGPQAYAFADFLKRSQQTVWQVLPLNPVSSGEGFSPYGSHGSFAGNELLISPELLMEEGLLTKDDLQNRSIKNIKKTDYEKAQATKGLLLDEAFLNAKKQHYLHGEYEAFCKAEDGWLHDFALYIVLKKENENKCWNEWDNVYKNRNGKALQLFAKAHADELERIKWQQWIFHKQWYKLKRYCNDEGILLFGDLPFYVSYNSTDVWVNKEIFDLDENGNTITEGGSPPDHFNEDGQRWGMPVYCWNQLKKTKYNWWLKRMKKNAAMFDLMRLDHFRGFSAYWEVKVNAKSAKEGRWVLSPGKEFFSVLKKDLDRLPLVAENLGSIDEPVTKLMNAFTIPGMLILQFAFEEQMPQNKFIPHHHILDSVVYTGNHDNNTTLSWFLELPNKVKKNICLYTNREVNGKNICDVMRHMLYASVAKLAILPMQDILELDENARMNSVSGGGESWTWRMKEKSVKKQTEKMLCDLCYLYDRNNKHAPIV